MFWLNQNKQKNHPNSLKQSIIGYFSGNLGLFRFVTKQFCLFRLFQYRFETPKQTEIFCFWFHKTNQSKHETDLVSVCFGSNRNLFLFVSRTPWMLLTVQCQLYRLTRSEKVAAASCHWTDSPSVSAGRPPLPPIRHPTFSDWWLYHWPGLWIMEVIGIFPKDPVAEAC
jgi:hypothetical protein